MEVSESYPLSAIIIAQLYVEFVTFVRTLVVICPKTLCFQKKTPLIQISSPITISMTPPSTEAFPASTVPSLRPM